MQSLTIQVIGKLLNPFTNFINNTYLHMYVCLWACWNWICWHCHYVVLVYVHVGIHVLCVGLPCGSATWSQPGCKWRHWWPRPSPQLQPDGRPRHLSHLGLGETLGVLLPAESQVLQPGHACHAAHPRKGTVPLHMQHVSAASGDALPLQRVWGETVKRPLAHVYMYC